MYVLMEIYHLILFNIFVKYVKHIKYQVSPSFFFFFFDIYSQQPTNQIASFIHIVWFEPTAVDKATVLSQDVILDSVCYISPNLAELRCIHDDLFKKHCGSTIGTPYPPISGQYDMETWHSLIPIP